MTTSELILLAKARASHFRGIVVECCDDPPSLDPVDGELYFCPACVSNMVSAQLFEVMAERLAELELEARG